MISMLPLWSKAPEDCIELPHLSRHVVGTWASGMPGLAAEDDKISKNVAEELHAAAVLRTYALTHPRQLRNRQPPPAKLPSPKDRPGSSTVWTRAARVVTATNITVPKHPGKRSSAGRCNMLAAGTTLSYFEYRGITMCQLFQRLCSTCCNSAERKRGSS